MPLHGECRNRFGRLRICSQDCLLCRRRGCSPGESKKSPGGQEGRCAGRRSCNVVNVARRGLLVHRDSSAVPLSAHVACALSLFEARLIVTSWGHRLYKACLGTASGFYNSVSMSWSLFRCRGLPRRPRSSVAHASERAQTMMELEASHRTGIRRQERLGASASTGRKSLSVRCRLCAPPSTLRPSPQTLLPAPCSLQPRRPECLLVLI